ncbi:MAG TPA: peroxiredoxin family protein [Polyangiaceae bacterium]|jgi:peroxiredoxin|nr:peroxiredoxin family protein [Polyangiaceae bacterium]
MRVPIRYVTPLAGLAFATLALLVVACGSSEGAQSSASAAALTSSARAMPTASGSADAKTSDKKPMMKEIEATPDSDLGKLAPDIGVPVGSVAPGFSLSDGDGKTVSLSELTKRGTVLVIFYRGGWCPYCNFEIHELTEAYPEFQKRGVTPVAISVDKPDEAAKMMATYSIPFPVLSDPDLTAHTAYHVIHKADDAEVAKLKGFGIDLEASSGKTHHSFAVPSLFLVDKTGKVRWAHGDPNYKVRPRTKQILAAIDALGPL